MSNYPSENNPFVDLQDDVKQWMLDSYAAGAKHDRAEQIYQVLNQAYDICVQAHKDGLINDDEFRKYFSGIADDYKMAKLFRDAAFNEWQEIMKKEF